MGTHFPFVRPTGYSAAWRFGSDCRFYPSQTQLFTPLYHLGEAKPAAIGVG